MTVEFDKKAFKAQFKEEMREAIKHNELKEQLKSSINKDEIKSHIKEAVNPKLIKESVKELFEENKLKTFKLARALNLAGFIISILFYIYFSIMPSGNFLIHSLLAFAIFFICYKHTDALVKVYTLFDKDE